LITRKLEPEMPDQMTGRLPPEGYRRQALENMICVKICDKLSHAVKAGDVSATSHI
jgi:hypothetical protein